MISLSPSVNLPVRGGLISLLAVFFIQVPCVAQPIRLGWQVPWAVQGQLVQILKHTDILKKQNLEVEFIGKTFGPELNELAMAGAVDVILTADQPAATLFAKNEKWNATARLMYNRTATYVPPNSDIQTIKDLKGKTVGLPVGAAAQRIFEQAAQSQGLEPKSDIKVINLGIQEHMPLLKKNDQTAKTWDQFDALVGFDPVPAIAETKKLAKIIHVGKVVSLIVMEKSFVEKNKEQAKKLIKAFELAYQEYKKNPALANKWFLEESKLTADDAALALAASLEVNLSSPKISMDFSSDDYQILDQAASFIETVVGKKVDMKSRVQFLK